MACDEVIPNHLAILVVGACHVVVSNLGFALRPPRW